MAFRICRIVLGPLETPLTHGFFAESFFSILSIFSRARRRWMALPYVHDPYSMIPIKPAIMATLVTNLKIRGLIKTTFEVPIVSWRPLFRDRSPELGAPAYWEVAEC